jgi:demethylspheroidene O-methyltransferase
VTARDSDSLRAAAPPRDVGLFSADHMMALRDRLLESPRFQRFSADFPLSRGIANGEAQALFDLCAGFVYSQILYACVTLGVFDILRGGPRTLHSLSHSLALPPAATERLMRGAIALRLVSRRKNDRYGLGMLGAALNGNPGVAAMVRHHAMLYRDLADPVALLRGERQGEMSGYWSYASPGDAGDDGEAVAEYSELMTASQAMISSDILDAYALSPHRKLLDIGGGEGAFVIAAAERHPGLSFQLFDLPAVAARARRNFARQGISSRAEATGGNFAADPLPAGADIVTLVRILHDHNDPAVLTLLRTIRAMLPEDGALLIAEPLAGTRGSERVGDAYFGFYLLAMGQGRPRSAAELTTMLREAGFSRVRKLRTRRPMLTSALLAVP